MDAGGRINKHYTKKLEVTVTPPQLRGSTDGAIKYLSGHLLPAKALLPAGYLEGVGKHFDLFFDVLRAGKQASTQKPRQLHKTGNIAKARARTTAGKQASKQASERASKQASTPASKQASRRVSERA